MNLNKYIKLFSIVLLCTSCAPGFSSKIPEPKVYFEKLDLAKLDNNPANLQKVHVDRFIDKRLNDTLFEVNGRSVSSEGEVGASVQAGFEEAFKNSGIDIGLFNIPTISGEILEWSSKVNPSFPSTAISAEATILVTVKDKEGKEVFTRKYEGSVNAKHPFMFESRAEKMLGYAMGQAIYTAVEDEDLRRVLG